MVLIRILPRNLLITSTGSLRFFLRWFREASNTSREILDAFSAISGDSSMLQWTARVRLQGVSEAFYGGAKVFQNGSGALHGLQGGF